MTDENKDNELKLKISILCDDKGSLNIQLNEKEVFNTWEALGILRGATLLLENKLYAND